MGIKCDQCGRAVKLEEVFNPDDLGLLYCNPGCFLEWVYEMVDADGFQCESCERWFQCRLKQKPILCRECLSQETGMSMPEVFPEFLNWKASEFVVNLTSEPKPLNGKP
jgi:hypothetical protein